MTKKEKLKKLDDLVLNKMISILEGDGDVSELRDLSTPANYLKANAVVEEKERDDVTDTIKKRLEEAKKRRAKKESK
jgi:hypothetical protein